MPPFQQVSSGGSSALLELPRSTVSAVIVKWKATQVHRTGPPSAEVCNNRLSTVPTLTTEFQTVSGSNVNTSTVRLELHEMGFHGRAAAHKPKIPTRNAKHWLEWCKAHCHWGNGTTFSGVMNHASPSGCLDKSLFGGFQENATRPNA